MERALLGDEQPKINQGGPVEMVGRRGTVVEVDREELKVIDAVKFLQRGFDPRPTVGEVVGRVADEIGGRLRRGGW